MTGFVKLYGTILTSSVWLESASTRVVWLTMLALCDKDGLVRAAIPGLAHAANVTVEECEEALRVLSAPDPASRTADNEGRRIEALPGGWVVLNYGAYRELRTEDQISAAARKRRQRAREKQALAEEGQLRGQRDTSRDIRDQSLLKRDTSRDIRQIAEGTDAETTTTTGSTRASEAQTVCLLGRIPQEYRDDVSQLIRNSADPLPWEAEIRAALDGVPGHPKATPAQVGRAIRDYRANGAVANRNLRQLRSYIKGAVAEDSNGGRSRRARSDSAARRTYANATAPEAQ